MRVIGGLLLTAAGLLAGLLQAAHLRETARRREELCRMLDMMEFELERFRTPLPALFGKLREQMAGDAGDFCRTVSAGFEAGEGYDLAGIWERALKVLPPPERGILRPLGAVLGRYGTEEQLRALAVCARDMERARDEARDEAREKGRLCVGLSAAGAAAMAVLLM